MAGSVTTQSFASALTTQIPKWFGMGYDEYPALYEKFMKVKRSNNAMERDALISGAGLMIQSAEGETTTYDSMNEGYTSTYIPVIYKLGMVITKEAMDDLRGLNLAEMRAKALGKASRETRNTVSTNILNRAFNSSYTGGDGLELCSTAHVTLSGTFSNELATSADLSEAALEQADLEMGDITDDRGLKIHTMSRALIVPRALKFEACRILKSEGRVGVTDNDLNALDALNSYPKGVVVNDYLTDTDAWFVMTNHDDQGLCMYVRNDREFSEDSQFDTDNIKYKLYERYSVGWTDPRCIFGSPGA